MNLSCERRAVITLVALTLTAWAVVIAGDFVYDDIHSVRDNPALRSLGNIPRFFVDVDLFSSLDCRLYRPVLLTTFAVDAALGGMQPWMFKLTNILLHTICVLLLFRVAIGLGLGTLKGAVAAGAFAVHPLLAEAINTVSGRSDILMAAGLLGAIACHLEAMRGRTWANLGTVACAVVSLGAKEPALILPLLLVILEWLHRPGPGDSRWHPQQAALRVLPVAAVTIGYLLLRSHLLGSGSFTLTRWEGADVLHGHSRGLATQLATMAVVLPRVALQVLVPHGMSMDPVIPYTDDWGAPVVWGGITLLVSLVAVGLWAPRRRAAVFFGTCLACGVAAPWVLKPLNFPYLEHRMYGVLAGVALALAAAPWPRSGWRHPLVLVSSAGVLLVLVCTNTARSLEFRTQEGLWRRELDRNPLSRMSRAGLAVCLMEKREFRAALPHLEAVLALDPARRDVRRNLVEAHLQSGGAGDPDVAVRHSLVLVERWPRSPFHHLLLSRSFAAMGERTGRRDYFSRAVSAALDCLRIAAPKGLVYRTAARARRLEGDLGGALELLDRSVASGIDHETVLIDRAAVLAAMGDMARAREDLLRARARAPFDPAIRDALHRLDAAGHAAPR